MSLSPTQRSFDYSVDGHSWNESAFRPFPALYLRVGWQFISQALTLWGQNVQRKCNSEGGRWQTQWDTPPGENFHQFFTWRRHPLVSRATRWWPSRFGKSIDGGGENTGDLGSSCYYQTFVSPCNLLMREVKSIYPCMLTWGKINLLRLCLWLSNRGLLWVWTSGFLGSFFLCLPQPLVRASPLIHHCCSWLSSEKMRNPALWLCYSPPLKDLGI